MVERDREPAIDNTRDVCSMYGFDLFCGAGGLTRGLLNAGIEVLVGFDLDVNCQRTYEENNPPAQFVSADLSTLKVASIAKHMRRRRPEDMLLAGCPPCQPFSQQRRQIAASRDAVLLGSFGRLVEALLPGQILVENVRGIAKVLGNSSFRRFLKTLERLDYKYVWGTLNAKWFGVPQNRWRLVLIAMRGTVPTLPDPQHGPDLTPYTTVRETISHFPAILAGGRHAKIPNHVAATITEPNLVRLRHTPHDGGDRRSWPAKLRLGCHTGDYEGHTDVYGRMFWDQPAPTLTGRCHSISNGRYGHPEQDRAISLREAAALQSFPDEYVFHGSSKSIALQIGNAVPVVLAEALGKHILALRAGTHVTFRKHGQHPSSSTDRKQDTKRSLVSDMPNPLKRIAGGS